MAQVSLRPITSRNFQQCTSLKVAESQKDNIPPNLNSLAYAYVYYSTCHPVGIYPESAIYSGPWKEDRLAMTELPDMIGFAMYQIINGQGWIKRLMIDEKWQGRGYGKAGMFESHNLWETNEIVLDTIVKRLRKHPDVEKILVFFNKENVGIEKFYASAGFVVCEAIEGNCITMEKK